jgi:DNA-binding transcriptional LysR family regulator
MAIERCFATHDLELQANMELGNSDAIKHGVMAGLGISVLSQHTVTFELAAGAIKLLDVENFPLKRDWYVAHLTEKKLSLVARTFLEFLLTNSQEVIQEVYQLLNDGGQRLSDVSE